MLPPSADPFHGPVPVTGPGAVVRSRVVDVASPVPVRAWQLVHGSTAATGRANAVSGTVLVPERSWTGPGPRPVLSYGVGVHGLGQDASPGHLLRQGLEAELALLAPVLERGWVVAVTDGEGLGMPGPHTYGAGLPGGHAVLDLVRAAGKVVPEVDPGAPVLLWGYSEGGRCVAWAAELQPAYAPELRLVGVAAGGVPSDLYAVARAIDGGPYSGLGLAVLVGLAHAHADPRLWTILSARGAAAAARAATQDVVGLVTGFPEPMRRHTVREEPWDEPVWRDLLHRERTGQRSPRVPVHLYHSRDDEVVPIGLALTLVRDYRGGGADVTWTEYAGTGHLETATDAAPAALTWLDDRLGDWLAASRRDRSATGATTRLRPTPTREGVL